MKISALVKFLESIAPLSLQEDYDNAGLITGLSDWETNGAVICLDATEEVIQEAIDKKFNLVIAHHPIVFRGLKKINGKNYVERTIIKAIKHDVAIYAIHTNLDNVLEGVNKRMAAQLGLINCTVLLPKPGVLKKLQVFVPAAQAEKVRNAIFEAGGGQIGNYSECSFNTNGTGTFTAGQATNPFVGKRGEQQHEHEIKIETIFPGWLEGKLIAAIKASHPYEEVAYDILPLENYHAGIGAGLVGELPDETDEKMFLRQVKQAFGVPVVRHTGLTGKKVKSIAVCGGAGSFLISKALAAGCQFYITADIKYHEFFEADGQLVIADIGHYESEQFTIALLADVLREKFPTFATLKTGVKTNPVHYFL